MTFCRTVVSHSIVNVPTCWCFGVDQPWPHQRLTGCNTWIHTRTICLLLCSASSYFSSDRHVTMQGRSAMSLSFLVQVSARIWLHRWLLDWYTLWIDDTLSFAFERRINQSDDQCLSIFDIYFIHVILIICYTSVVYYTSLSWVSMFINPVAQKSRPLRFMTVPCQLCQSLPDKDYFAMGTTHPLSPGAWRGGQQGHSVPLGR